jgi:predicted DNA-binding protein (MmcQ/YjbR family)
MNADWVRTTCLAFPGAIEQVIWEGDLTFKVGGKMFAHTVLEVAPVWLSFKTSHENFAQLTERAGIIPAPYLARAQWVALEKKDALPLDELAALLRASYELVVTKLPRRIRESLAKGKSARTSAGEPEHRKTKRAAKSRGNKTKSRVKKKKPG